MNKQQIITAMSEKIETSKKDTEKVLQAFLEVVTEELVKGEEINLSGFGKFATSEVAEKEGTIQLGDRKGEKYVTPAHTKPTFRFSKSIKDLVKNK